MVPWFCGARAPLDGENCRGKRRKEAADPKGTEEDERGVIPTATKPTTRGTGRGPPGSGLGRRRRRRTGEGNSASGRAGTNDAGVAVSSPNGQMELLILFSGPVKASDESPMKILYRPNSDVSQISPVPSFWKGRGGEVI